jgi:N,N'-diacetyllegionaminate synthase
MTELILEIGGNHKGNIDSLFAITEDAISAGGKYLKYQIYTGNSLVNATIDADRKKHFDNFTISVDIYKEIAQECSKKGVYFLASVWDPLLFREVERLSPIVKIGSGDLTNYSLLMLAAETGKKIILSTGLSNFEEVKEAVRFIRTCNEVYFSTDHLCVMQCTSVYPCPLNEVNLSVINTYKDTFGCQVGYSHHCLQYQPIYSAISMGVDWLEVHYSKEKHDTSFRDNLLSIDSTELKKINAFIDENQVILGTPTKVKTKSEISTGHVQSFRRAIYLAKDIEAGHRICEDDLVCLRPDVGIPASHFQNMLNKTTKKKLTAYSPLSHNDFKDV